MKLGFQDKRTKYIVWFDGDGNPAGCGGSTCISQASKKGPDDRLSEDNVYNSGPDYALLFKIEDDKVAQFGTTRDMFVPIAMLHEYAHTMGAVQPSAPHSTKKEMNKIHCTDSQTIGRGGTDIMCKSDAQGEVFGNACPGMYPFHFDCNNDDYFNPNPDPGSYLATHWNVGSRLNRFIKFDQ
jgi:FAD/FMN-containing dehydrogenase